MTSGSSATSSSHSSHGAAAAAGQGVTLVDWSGEERRKFREVASSVWKEYAARSELGTRIYESQLGFLKKLGLLK